MKKSLIIVGSLIVLIIVGSIAWYLVSPLFIDEVVDEEFPFDAASSQPADEEAGEMEAVAAEPDSPQELQEADVSGQGELVQISQESLDQIEAEMGEQLSFEMPTAGQLAEMPEETLQEMEAEIMAVAAEMPDKAMDDPMPEAAAEGPVVVGQGQFQGADSFHQGSGTATIYQLPDGSNVLRFEEFSATNGPDLHVLLTKHPAPASRADIMADYVDLGSLKGNIGNQNYEVPAGVDVSEYQSVVIYCMPFHVVFATASLG